MKNLFHRLMCKFFFKFPHWVQRWYLKKNRVLITYRAEYHPIVINAGHTIEIHTNE